MRKRWLMILMTGLLIATAPAMNAGTLAAFAADGTDSTVSVDENAESLGIVTAGTQQTTASGSAAAGNNSGTSTSAGSTSSVTAFRGGTGTQSDPYRISNANDLTAFASNVTNSVSYQGQYFRLESDINLNGSSLSPIGITYFDNTGENSYPFSGIFDGNGHTISNFTIDTTGTGTDSNASADKDSYNNYQHNKGDKISAGLFGYVNGGTIQNLTISNADVRGWNAEGAAVGTLVSGTLSNVKVTNSTITGKYENAGGLIGRTSGKITVTNCSVSNSRVQIEEAGQGASEEEKKSRNGAGGLIGRTQGDNGSEITGNTVTETTVSAYRKAAGLIGYILQPTSITITGNTVNDSTVNVNTNAKNRLNQPYSGIYTAEIQGNPNTNRGYETYNSDGSVNGIQWTDNNSTKIGSPSGTTVTMPVATASNTSNMRVSGNGTISPARNATPSTLERRPTPSSHTISIFTPRNGRVSITRDRAERGETVTIYVSPNRGYVLDSLRVRDANGNSITVNKGKEDRYTFIMPHSSVTVTPKFRKRGSTVRSDPTPTPKPANSDNQKNTSSKSTAQKTVTMYRLYNPNSGEHFYTGAKYERDVLMVAGWNYEGVGWTAPKTGEPVYRLYNSNAGDHHYTVSKVEKDVLVALGWKYEGIGWYSGGKVPIYRQYNPNAVTGTHNYTRSRAENNKLVSLGWRQEGIGWYAEK